MYASCAQTYSLATICAQQQVAATAVYVPAYTSRISYAALNSSTCNTPCGSVFLRPVHAHTAISMQHRVQHKHTTADTMLSPNLEKWRQARWHNLEREHRAGSQLRACKRTKLAVWCLHGPCKRYCLCQGLHPCT